MPVTPEPTTDPGHLLPPDVWDEVVAQAESIYAEHTKRRLKTVNLVGSEDYGHITKRIPAYSHGGHLARPTLLVVHDAETPLKAGYATSIANWFGTPAPGTSAHAIADPADLIEMLADNVIAWHVGPAANGFTLGIEQAGYARFSRSDWTTPDALVQIRRVGAWLRAKALAHGIPLRWATDDQIRAAAHGVPGGICRHADIARVLGGTTHTDPTPNYPYDLLQQAWGTSPQGGFLADLTEAQQGEMYRWIRDLATINPPYTEKPTPTQLVLGDIFVNARRAAAPEDPQAIAAALLPALTDSLKAALADNSAANIDADAIAAKVVDDLAGRIAA